MSQPPIVKISGAVSPAIRAIPRIVAVKSPLRAAGITIVETEQLVNPGEINPDSVHLSSIYVDRVVKLSPDEASFKPIEQLTIRKHQ